MVLVNELRWRGGEPRLESRPTIDVPNKSAEKPIHMQQQRQYEQREQKQQPEQPKQQQR